MAFNPLKHAFDDDGKPTPALNGFLDNALKVQRPVVLRWVKRLRAEHPDETPEQRAVRLQLEAEARQVSERIDEQIKAERAALKKSKPVKVLLLGQSESGPSATLPSRVPARSV